MRDYVYNCYLILNKIVSCGSMVWNTVALRSQVWSWVWLDYTQVWQICFCWLEWFLRETFYIYTSIFISILVFFKDFQRIKFYSGLFSKIVMASYFLLEPVISLTICHQTVSSLQLWSLEEKGLWNNNDRTKSCGVTSVNYLISVSHVQNGKIITSYICYEKYVNTSKMVRTTETGI